MTWIFDKNLNQLNMKKILIILTATLFITLTVKGQNFFFIGENSYPSTETFRLQSNSDKVYINDLNVLFAKQGTLGLIAVSTKTIDVLIRGKLTIYLGDGTVITCNDARISDYVDEIASSVYYFTIEDLSKMKNSNINTIRYTLEDEYGNAGTFGGNFSASNKGTPTKTLITKFFD